ncbi:MAG: PIN domain-containing protein [Acidobacteria bacterium]|nr:PIN domain-containing protein [Acidobacteriota bacterium]
MIGVDTNILVYAHRADSPWHQPASAMIASLAEGSENWAIPWPVVHEFLAIVTHPRIYDPPTPTDRAISQLEAWMEAPRIRLIGEDSGYWPHLRDVVAGARIAGPAIHDARIAAICIRWNLRELWTADRDFSRFRDLKVRNPLVDSVQDSR